MWREGGETGQEEDGRAKWFRGPRFIVSMLVLTLASRQTCSRLLNSDVLLWYEERYPSFWLILSSNYEAFDTHKAGQQAKQSEQDRSLVQIPWQFSHSPCWLHFFVSHNWKKNPRSAEIYHLCLLPSRSPNWRQIRRIMSLPPGGQLMELESQQATEEALGLESCVWGPLPRAGPSRQAEGVNKMHLRKMFWLANYD